MSSDGSHASTEKSVTSATLQSFLPRAGVWATLTLLPLSVSRNMKYACLPSLAIGFEAKLGLSSGLKSLIALWCNGSTTVFGSVCRGSNPRKATRKSPDCKIGAFSCWILTDRACGLPQVLSYYGSFLYLKDVDGSGMLGIESYSLSVALMGGLHEDIQLVFAVPEVYVERRLPCVD